jgi:hypothetical protein
MRAKRVTYAFAVVGSQLAGPKVDILKMQIQLRSVEAMAANTFGGFLKTVGELAGENA